MFQTVPETEFQPLTGLAIRMPVCLPGPEGFIGCRVERLFPGRVHAVSEPEALPDKKITWINISVEFHHKVLAAVPSQRADIG